MIEPVITLRRRLRGLDWVASLRQTRHRHACICRDRKDGWPCPVCQGLPDDHRMNSKLCDQCQGWDDLDHIVFCTQDNYFEEPDNGGWDNAMLRNLVFYPLETLLRRDSCLVCNHIAVALDKHLGHAIDVQVAIGRLFLYGTHAAHGPNDVRNHVPNGPNHCILKLCVATRENGSTKYSPLALEFILHYKGPGKQLDSIVRWDRSYVNTDLVTRWLGNCQKYHNEKCNALVVPMSLPHHFRLIDTTEWCVTESFEQPVTYFALSYVWGGASAPTDVVSTTPFQLELSNLEQLGQKDSLRTSLLPALLKDAIQFCADMGQRYLWIDRLCIVQDDEVNRGHQIEAMGAIYHMATLTIVALGNTIGLPGVSTRPRPSIPNQDIWTLYTDGRECLMSHEPYVKSVVADSIWNRRGWTYQERILSRRTLIFSQGHIYLNCEHDQHGEDNYALISDEAALEGAQRALTVFDRNVLGVNLWQTGRRHHDYVQLLVEYLGRSLTQSSDILNAFLGVERIMGQQLQTSFIFGHPERYFLLSFLWSYIGRTGSRDKDLRLPSWSWAAWDFSTPDRTRLYGNPIHMLKPNDLKDIGHLVWLYYSDPITKSVRMIDEDRVWFNLNPLSNDVERSKDWWKDGLYSMNNRSVPESVWVHSPWEAEQRANISDQAISLAKSFPGSVTFVTTCAVVGLEDDRRFNNRGDGFISLKLTNDRGDRIGDTMKMEADWAEQTFPSGKLYDVIVLGAGHPLGEENCNGVVTTDGKDRRYPLGDPFTLYVMIIVPVGEVWRRLAIGAVNPRAWTEMKPLWKSITLI